MSNTLTLRPFHTTCSGCATRVTIKREHGVVSTVIPSNGLRGSKHVASHVEVQPLLDDDDNLVTWDCPACGYADSFDLHFGEAI